MQTFERSYLLRSGKEVNERLQFLYMRVAIGIHGSDIDGILETYELLSLKKISVASPILWNGGLTNRHYASCYIFDPFAVEPKDAISNFTALSTLWAADGGVGIHGGEVPATRYVVFVGQPICLISRIFEGVAIQDSILGSCPYLRFTTPWRGIGLSQVAIVPPPRQSISLYGMATSGSSLQHGRTEPRPDIGSVIYSLRFGSLICCVYLPYSDVL